MRYIIFFPGKPPFCTRYLNVDNFTENITVVDLEYQVYTTDGETWIKMQTDHL